MADNAKWYVAHTYSGYENAVKTAIEKFVANRHLEDMILDIQIPMETVTEVTESGAVKEVERKTFDPQADRFEGRLVGFAYRQVDVRVRVNARCLTPVGEAALSAAGAVNGLQLSSAASRTVSVDADAEVGHGRR